MNLPKILSWILGAALVYGALTLYAYHTQVVVYSQDLPPNIVCVKDNIPDAYLCLPDEDVPSVSYTHLRAHETREDRVWPGGLEKK